MSAELDRKTWNGEYADGEAAMYFCTPEDRERYVGEYVIDWRGDVSRKNLRGYRERQRRAGQSVPRQRDEELKHGLFVIIGADTSAKEVVISLRKLADQIEKRGLLVGRDRDGSYLAETYDGEII